MTNLSPIALSPRANDTAPALPNIANATDRKAINKVAKEYEAVFVQEMMSHMFKGIRTDGLMGGGNSEEIFRSMLIKEYAKGITERGGLGLSPALQAEMIRLQEGSR